MNKLTLHAYTPNMHKSLGLRFKSMPDIYFARGRLCTRPANTPCEAGRWSTDPLHGVLYTSKNKSAAARKVIGRRRLRLRVQSEMCSGMTMRSTLGLTN